MHRVLVSAPRESCATETGERAKPATRARRRRHRTSLDMTCRVSGAQSARCVTQRTRGHGRGYESRVAEARVQQPPFPLTCQWFIPVQQHHLAPHCHEATHGGIATAPPPRQAATSAPSHAGPGNAGLPLCPRVRPLAMRAQPQRARAWQRHEAARFVAPAGPRGRPRAARARHPHDHAMQRCGVRSYLYTLGSRGGLPAARAQWPHVLFLRLRAAPDFPPSQGPRGHPRVHPARLVSRRSMRRQRALERTCACECAKCSFPPCANPARRKRTSSDTTCPRARRAVLGLDRRWVRAAVCDRRPYGAREAMAGVIMNPTRLKRVLVQSRLFRCHAHSYRPDYTTCT
jgi:hypothetical protein